MKNEYREIVKQQHAPESLIDKTLEKLADEGKKQKEKKKQKKGFVYFGIPAVAAILSFIFYPHEVFYYSPVSENLMREKVLTAQIESVEMNQAELQDYLAISKENWMEDYSLEKVLVQRGYGADLKTVTEETMVLYFEAEESRVLVKLSNTESEMAKKLCTGKDSRIEGKKVWLGETEGQFYAAGKLENETEMYFTVMCPKAEKADFEKFLKNFLNF